MDIHDFYRPILTYFRTKRMAEFCRLFAIDEKTRIVDVGGYEFNWMLIKEAPEVLMINLENEEWQRGRFRKQRGDGRALELEDDSFDIAFSNSVIEHVGEWADQVAFAQEIRRVAPSYYVQTPNRYFFFEPHLLAPFVHLLPRRVLRRIVRYCTGWGLMTKPTQEQVDSCLCSIRLLTKAEMKRLFPDADIIEEKVLGITKSLIAVRKSTTRIGADLRTQQPGPSSGTKGVDLASGPSWHFALTAPRSIGQHRNHRVAGWRIFRFIPREMDALECHGNLLRTPARSDFADFA